MRKVFIFGMSILQKDVKLFSCRYLTQALPVVDYPVYFPITNLLATDVQEDDEVVLVSVHNESVMSLANNELFKQEAGKALNGHSYEWSSLEFNLSDGKAYLKVFDRLCAKLQPGDTVYADITYGFKPLPIVIFSALSYKVKSMDIDVKYVIYGELYDGSNQKKKGTAILRDLAPIFYLNAQTSEIAQFETNTGEKIMKDLLS